MIQLRSPIPKIRVPPMDLSINQIDIIMAYILPGIVAMWGLGYLSGTVNKWLRSDSKGPTLGGTLLLILGALSAGLIANALREQTIDWVHHHTGVEQPTWSFSQLSAEKFPLFEGIVQNDFRYHQFYGNSFLCILFAYGARQVKLRKWPWPPWLELGVVFLLVVTWMGSRSDLKESYEAIKELLSP
jgi:hypothetical protein